MLTIIGTSTTSPSRSICPVAEVVPWTSVLRAVAWNVPRDVPGNDQLPSIAVLVFSCGSDSPDSDD